MTYSFVSVPLGNQEESLMFNLYIDNAELNTIHTIYVKSWNCGKLIHYCGDFMFLPTTKWAKNLTFFMCFLPVFLKVFFYKEL